MGLINESLSAIHNGCNVCRNSRKSTLWLQIQLLRLHYLAALFYNLDRLAALSGILKP